MMRRKFDYEKEQKSCILREESLIMRRKLFCGKGSSMTRRKFDYEKEVVSWKRKFYDEKKV